MLLTSYFTLDSPLLTNSLGHFIISSSRAGKKIRIYMLDKLFDYDL